MSESQQPQKPEKASSLRRIRRRVAVIATFLVLILLISIVIGTILVLSPNIQTQTALPATLADSIAVQGFVVLDETSVVREGSGYLYYTVADGERVPAGTSIADSYASQSAAQARVSLESVNAELAQLQQAQSDYIESGDVESLMAQRQNEMYGLLDVLDSGDYGNLDTALASVTLASNKLQVATGESVDFSARIAYLTQQQQQYIEQAVPQNSLAAPVSGYFVPPGKYDQMLKEYEPLQQASAQELQEMLNEPPTYYSENVVGHVVSDYKWSFFTVVSLEEAAKFTLGSKLKIAFPDYSDTSLPVEVADIDEDEANGIAKIELLCEHMNTQILSLRTEKAQIIFSEMSGIRIDKKALRIKDGQYFVYVKFGNLVLAKKIRILLEDDNYVLIPATVESGVNEVTLYDDVIVDNGGLELSDRLVL